MKFNGFFSTIYPYMKYSMMSESKGQKAVHACMIRLLNLGPAKHEKAAIYAVNQRILNVYRIAGAALQRSNSQASVGVKRPFDPKFPFQQRKYFTGLYKTN